MSDAVTSIIGAALMVTFIVLIAARVNETPLWIACLIAIALMLWAVWIDALKPIFGRRSD